MNLPSLSNLTMRALVCPPCPSATKMSPFGAVTTADGALNSSGRAAGLRPALPSTSSTLPSGLNLNTWWPLPPRPSPSVTQTLPARSTCRPCGNSSKPAPKLFSSLPDVSNLRIGSSVEPPHANADAFGFDARGRRELRRSARRPRRWCRRDRCRPRWSSPRSAHRAACPSSRSTGTDWAPSWSAPPVGSALCRQPAPA